MTNFRKSGCRLFKKAERVDTPQKRLYIQLSNPTQLGETLHQQAQDSSDVTVFFGHLRNAQ